MVKFYKPQEITNETVKKIVNNYEHYVNFEYITVLFDLINLKII
jgi:hypothetical protein